MKIIIGDRVIYKFKDYDGNNVILNLKNNPLFDFNEDPMKQMSNLRLVNANKKDHE